MHDLQSALEENAWDGDWYRRAYYDDGTPLGSVKNKECRIDSIAQSWAVLSGAGSRERITKALKAQNENLVDVDARLIMLFTPPFDKTKKDPGYIKGYPPGIRENGGQYTHAAVWAVWAYTEIGESDRAGELLRLLNPILHSDTRSKAERYRVEPYVAAADIYSVTPFKGRGGWTWYTGSAGWLYRLGLEAILGIKRHGRTLSIDPCIPRDWPGFTLTYRFGRSMYHIEVVTISESTAPSKTIALDGQPVIGTQIALEDDGSDHRIRVQLSLSPS